MPNGVVTNLLQAVIQGSEHIVSTLYKHYGDSVLY